MTSIVLQQLDRYGPDHCETVPPSEARRYAVDLATSHYENFTVVSRVLPARLREDFAAVYAFCRWADDLGDETGDPRRSLELLDWWRQELDACYRGEPRHPVFVALKPTIEKHDIPATPFEKLIDAFVQDQRLTRSHTWEQVVDYCTRSADPVGRLVLYMCGYRDEQRQRLSDCTCTALQLANFWQDVRRDILERDRIYVPDAALSEHGLTHDDLVAAVRDTRPLTAEQRAGYRAAMRQLVDRTWALFDEGRRLWPTVHREVRLSIRLFTMGGESILRMIERQNYNTLDHRPSLSRTGKLRLMAGGLVGHWLDRRPAKEPAR